MKTLEIAPRPSSCWQCVLPSKVPAPGIWDLGLIGRANEQNNNNKGSRYHLEELLRLRVEPGERRGHRRGSFFVRALRCLPTTTTSPPELLIGSRIRGR